jgi:hypothetical protein
MCVFLSKIKTPINEMHDCNLYSKISKNIYSLPTDSSLSINKCEWDYVDPAYCNGLFDAASVGQFLFGIDGRHLIGPLKNHFVNETSIHKFQDIKIKYCDFDNCFFISNSTKKYKLYNIHVHSKIFDRLNNHTFNNYTTQATVIVDFNFKNTIINIITRLLNKFFKISI